jgi:hypothetical protein
MKTALIAEAATHYQFIQICTHGVLAVTPIKRVTEQ